uniref:Glutaryl-CoA dehydrogenase n=1 Tax=Phasianus colchicus TaxID=9054 RepID=A0A669QX40_PHACC
MALRFVAPLLRSREIPHVGLLGRCPHSRRLISPHPTPPATFHWGDPLVLEELLSPEERMLRDAVRKYSQEQLLPRVLRANRHEGTTPPNLHPGTQLGPLRRGCSGVGVPRVWLRGDHLGGLWAGDTGVGACGQQLPLGAECAVVPRHAPHPGLRDPSSARTLPACSGKGGDVGLLRADRAQPRERPWKHGDARTL